MKTYLYYRSPVGLLELSAEGSELCGIRFCGHKEHDEGSGGVLDETARQLEAYFNGERTSFNLPLKLSCSDFRHEIYHQLMRVPFGRTVSYKTLATLAGRPKASRAVGSAMAANDFVIVIPCHRVVKSDGTLGNYSGGNGTETKRRLLEHESHG